MRRFPWNPKYTDPSELLMNQHSGLPYYAVRAEEKEAHEFEAVMSKAESTLSTSASAGRSTDSAELSIRLLRRM